VKKRKISCPCQELNSHSSVIQPISLLTAILSYPEQYGLRKTTRDIGEISFVNRTIAEWNQLPEGVTETSPIKTHTFRKRVMEVKIREVK
jgi:hypothetical protein